MTDDNHAVTSFSRKYSIDVFGWHICIGKIEERGGIEVIEDQLEDEAEDSR